MKPAREPASSRPKPCASLKNPTIFARSPLLVGPRRKENRSIVVRKQLFPQKPPASHLVFCPRDVGSAEPSHPASPHPPSVPGANLVLTHRLLSPLPLSAAVRQFVWCHGRWYELSGLWIQLTERTLSTTSDNMPLAGPSMPGLLTVSSHFPHGLGPPRPGGSQGRTWGSRRMRRLTTRDAMAEPVARNQVLRRERGQQGNIHFPCSVDHEQDRQPHPVDPYYM